MAVTITQEPSGWIFARSNPIIVSASSTNVANTGFKFVVDVECAGVTKTYLYPPNSSNRLICNVQPMVLPFLGPRLAGDDVLQSSIHELGLATATLHLNELATANDTKPVQHVTVTVKEGWIIAGVFTPTAVGSDSTNFVIQNIAYPGLFNAFNYEGALQQNTTDRDEYTGTKEFELAETYGLFSYDRYVPTHANDRGILSFITDDGTYHTNGIASYIIRGVMVEEDGTTTTKDIVIAGVAGQITHFGCYPYNLNNSSIGASFFDTISYPNYRYYTIALHSNTNPAKPQIGYRYVFFEKEYHCKYNMQSVSGSIKPHVQIAWLNDQGFYDYMNFNYKVEYTQKSERKRMAKVVGEWSGTEYSVNQYDRGISELNVGAYRTISLTTKKLDEGEFRLLSSLQRSTEVHLLTDVSGFIHNTRTMIPVVLEFPDNTEHRPLDSKAREITIIAREAHNVI